MKTLLKSLVVLFVTSVFAIPASASTLQETNLINAQDTVVKKDTTVKEDAPVLLAANEVTYTKIETSAIPETVTKAMNSKYEGYTIQEAYKGSDNSYKLSIKKADATLTVYYNEAGEFQKEETPTTSTHITYQI